MRAWARTAITTTVCTPSTAAAAVSTHDTSIAVCPAIDPPSPATVRPSPHKIASLSTARQTFLTAAHLATRSPTSTESARANAASTATHSGNIALPVGDVNSSSAGPTAMNTVPSTSANSPVAR